MSDVNQAHLEKLETLPEGWAESTVSEIVQMVSANNKKLAQKYYLEEGEYPVIDQGQNFIGGYSNDKDLVVEEEPPFIVFGDHTRAFKFANFQFIPGADGVKIMKPVGVEPKWCYYIFQAIRLPNKGYARHFQYLKEAYVPVPPPEQQKHIVAKIEELFSHIDAGIEALKEAKQLLKQYRQSVLKAAVTGELTKEWREANKDKLEPASQLLERILKERRERWEEQQLEQFKVKGKMPKDDKWKNKYKEPHLAEYVGDIPAGWVAVTASQLAEHIVDGTHHTPKYVDEGIDFVSARNINDWEIDYSNTKKITKEEHEQLIKRCHPERGDVLLTKSGTLGRAAVVKDDNVFSVFESVAVFPIVDKSISDYIVLAIHEAAMGDAGRKIQKGIAVKHLHLEDLRKMEFLLPPKREIQKIVRVFENVTTASSRLESELVTKLIQAEKNKQSVLVSAFTGRMHLYS